MRPLSVRATPVDKVPDGAWWVGPYPVLWDQRRTEVLARAAGRCEVCRAAEGSRRQASGGAGYLVVLQVLPYQGAEPRAVCQACGKAPCHKEADSERRSA